MKDQTGVSGTFPYDKKWARQQKWKDSVEKIQGPNPPSPGAAVFAIAPTLWIWMLKSTNGKHIKALPRRGIIPENALQKGVSVSGQGEHNMHHEKKHTQKNTRNTNKHRKHKKDDFVNFLGVRVLQKCQFFCNLGMLNLKMCFLLGKQNHKQENLSVRGKNRVKGKKKAKLSPECGIWKRITFLTEIEKPPEKNQSSKK